MIEWLFFDVGNVLYHDLAQSLFGYRFLHDFLNRSGKKFSFAEVMHEREELASTGAQWIPKKIARKYLPEDVIAAHWPELRRQLTVDYDKNHLPHEGVVEVLETLHPKFRLGVIANQSPECRHSLQRRGLLDYFSVAAISEELDLYKPDVALFRWAVEQAGCEPEKSIMVGDRLDNDVSPAAELGMKTIHLDWQNSAHDDWKPVDDHGRLYLESINRLPPFPQVVPSKPADQTVTSLRDVPNAIHQIASAC